MKDIRRVMVAIGQTPYSKGNFECAVKMATLFGAHLIVVSVINEKDVDAVRAISAMGYDVDQEHYVQEIRRQREEYIRGLLLECPFPEERVTVRVRVGNPLERLLQSIVEEEADMIVMGPKGRTNLETMLVGSVASKLFRRSPVTVVSYRDEVYGERMRRFIDMKE